MDSETGPRQDNAASDTDAAKALSYLDQLERFQLAPMQVELVKEPQPDPGLSPQQQELWQWLDDAGYRLPLDTPDSD